MINILFENIQEHLSMLDKALQSSYRITLLAKEEKLDEVISETENRERIVNIITQIQHSIENQITQMNAAEFKPDDIAILKAWFHDLGQWSEKMISMDQATVEYLAQQKENTTKEIASLFKNKELFKGYNHNLKK